MSAMTGRTRLSLARGSTLIRFAPLRADPPLAGAPPRASWLLINDSESALRLGLRRRSRLLALQAEADRLSVRLEALGLGQSDGRRPKGRQVVGPKGEDRRDLDKVVDADGRGEARGPAGGHDVTRAG